MWVDISIDKTTDENLQPEVAVLRFAIGKSILELGLEEVLASGVESGSGKRHKSQEQREEVHLGRTVL